jgi:hypothetical protein
MKIPMACALFAASALAGALLPAAAQVNPGPAQPQQPSTERTPPLPKVSRSPEPTETTGARLLTDPRDVQARTPLILQAPNLEQTEAASELPRTCAHILIYVAPPTADDKMMIKVPRDDSTVPTYQGLPPCSRDFRPLFFAALGPVFRFMKPGRPEAPPPASEKPSGLTQPK